MTCFMKNGTTFYPASEESLDIHKELPVGNYIVKENPMTEQLYFDSVSSFEEKGKIYGKAPQQAERILNTFYDRNNSTGVLLNGEKGSGKTLLARLLSIGAAKASIPTIIINTPYHGEKFNKLIQDITQPAVILFDEFEKVYDSEAQEEVLTLFDGVFPSKKLFIITCNDKYRIDEHMRNRPGRLYYMLDFVGLEESFITEYCNEKLNDTSHTPTICKISTLFESFNFDILKALVEEMNRYGEDPHQALEMLNAKPFTGSNDIEYDVQVVISGTVVNDRVYPKVYYGNPLTGGDREITHYSPKSRKSSNNTSVKLRKGGVILSAPECSSDEDDTTCIEYVLSPDMLTSIDNDGKVYKFTVGQGVQIMFTRRVAASFNYKDLMAF